MKKFLKSVRSFLVKHKKKALTILATGAAAAADGASGFQVAKEIAKKVMP